MVLSHFYYICLPTNSYKYETYHNLLHCVSADDQQNCCSGPNGGTISKEDRSFRIDEEHRHYCSIDRHTRIHRRHCCIEN